MSASRPVLSCFCPTFVPVCPAVVPLLSRFCPAATRALLILSRFWSAVVPVLSRCGPGVANFFQVVSGCCPSCCPGVVPLLSRCSDPRFFGHAMFRTRACSDPRFFGPAYFPACPGFVPRWNHVSNTINHCGTTLTPLSNHCGTTLEAVWNPCGNILKTL